MSKGAYSLSVATLARTWIPVLSKTFNNINAFVCRNSAIPREIRKVINLLKTIKVIFLKSVQNSREIPKVIKMILSSAHRAQFRNCRSLLDSSVQTV